MIGFEESFLVWFASTLIPAFVGLLTITWLGKKIPVKYLLAFAFGIMSWFFVDTISGSAVLDVNSGFGGGLAQFGVVALFLTGVLFFFWVDRRHNILSPLSAVGKYGVAIPILVTIALGIHGVGEGAAYGATSHSTLSTSISDAFGGLTAGVAYVLHKGLEPMMSGACYLFYYDWRGGTVAKWLKHIFSLSVIFAIPSLVGAATGYFVLYDTTFFFALGTGTSIYAIFRLAGPLFSKEEEGDIGAVQVAIAWVLGIMAIYVAALIHSL